jgi:tyrosyl-tRNA synthetase
VLATEATALLHGRDAANRRRNRAADLRGRRDRGKPADRGNSARRTRAGIGVLGLFVKAGLVASNGEARRQIKGGGLRVNDVAVTDEKMVLNAVQPHAGRRHQAVDGQEAHVLLKPA